MNWSLYKANSPLPFLISYTVPLLAIWGFLQGGWFNFAVPVYIFVLVPLLDALLGTYTYNPTQDETVSLAANKSFSLIAWPHVPLLLGLVIWGAWAISN